MAALQALTERLYPNVVSQRNSDRPTVGAVHTVATSQRDNTPLPLPPSRQTTFATLPPPTPSSYTPSQTQRGFCRTVSTQEYTSHNGTRHFLTINRSTPLASTTSRSPSFTPTQDYTSNTSVPSPSVSHTTPESTLPTTPSGALGTKVLSDLEIMQESFDSALSSFTRGMKAYDRVAQNLASMRHEGPGRANLVNSTMQALGELSRWANLRATAIERAFVLAQEVPWEADS